MSQIISNLTAGAKMSTDLNAGNTFYGILIPAIPGGISQENINGTTVASVTDRMQGLIQSANQFLANPAMIKPPLTQNGLNQTIAIYTSLITQFTNQANNDLKKLQTAQIVAAPAPTPTPAVTTTPAPTAAPNTTANAAVTTKVTANTVTKTTVTNVTNSTANTKSTTTTVKSANTTTDPSRVIISTQDIVINPEPLTIPIIDIKTGKVTGNTTVPISPIKIPGETVYANGVSVTTTGEVKPAVGPTAPAAQPPTLGLTAGITTAASKATAQDQANFDAQADWRVRLALAPGSNYLYNNPEGAGILQPLVKTKGVVFPYTPGITVNYAANYDPVSLTHTNYKINQYQNSSVDSVNITCDFTAQDVFEANYLLAVIHFFRTMTKMFYGKDDNPIRGTPPPLCYLYGLGGFQFDALPLAISGFNYSLPQDVDYIKTTGASAAGTPQPSVQNGATTATASGDRLGPALQPGGKGAKANYGSTPTQSGVPPTWVPTKIQLAITCLPIMSRNAVSNKFSLKEYANGTLLNGTRNGATGGGFW